MAHTLMKNGIGEAAVTRISRALRAAGAEFSEQAFQADALASLDRLELKDRVRHLILVMGRHLPQKFPEAARILGSIREHWDEGMEDDPHRGFAAWPVIDFVAEYGINHPRLALPLLRYLTPMFTAEWAIRPFLEAHPDQTYNQMLLWCMDADEHVRRLASEGTRPRLPWGKQLTGFIDDPSPIIRLVETLKDDPADYVRRSVANNLNDISKDHPEVVIETCRRWLKDAVPERKWIIRHATRGLVKQGHPEVFQLLGFTKKPKLDVSTPAVLPNPIKLGQDLMLYTTITSTSAKNQRVVVDYALYLMKANGRTSPKVFKWKNLSIKPGQSVSLEKKHPFKAITTRRYYPGVQKVAMMVNGKELSEADFELII